MAMGTLPIFESKKCDARHARPDTFVRKESHSRLLFEKCLGVLPVTCYPFGMSRIVQLSHVRMIIEHSSNTRTISLNTGIVSTAKSFQLRQIDSCSRDVHSSQTEVFVT